MNTLALVQMAREFAECGREDEAQRVMDEACEGLGQPMGSTWSSWDLTWGAYSKQNVTRRAWFSERLRNRNDPSYEWRLTARSFTVTREQMYRNVILDEGRHYRPAQLSDLLRQIGECLDRSRSLPTWQSRPGISCRVGKFGGVLSRELWRSTQ